MTTDPQAAPTPPSVLLIDDNADMVRVLHLAFRTFLPSVRLDSASNGQAGLDRLRQMGTADLVIADLMMPTMDGGTLVRMLAEDPALSGIPVFILSAVGQERVHGLLALPNVKGVFRKPVDPVTFTAEVAKALGI